MQRVEDSNNRRKSPRRDVSVAIATYNGAAYLPELLDSILAQTLPPKEIVCADDASSDNTVEILEKYADASPIPFKIIRHAENVGVVKNFLSAFRETSCSLIAYCDQDDVWFEEKLRECVGIFEDEEVSLVCHASVITDGDLNETGQIAYQLDKDQRLRFPGVSVKLSCWGHQTVFDRPALKNLLQLHECGVFQKSILGRNFDCGIPFAASLAGDLYAMRAALVKFRRHATALTPTAKTPPKGKGVSARVAERLARLDWRAAAMTEALDVIGACPMDGARALEQSRRAYADYDALIERRVRLGKTPGIFARAAKLPGLYAWMVESAQRDEFKLKELAADLLTVVYAGAESAPPRRH